MNSLIRQILLLLTCLAVLGCESERPATGAQSAHSENPLLVVASNYPLYFFASQIATGLEHRVEIELPEIDGDPATWRPDSQAIARLQNADLVILNGAGYESWLGWVTLAEDRLLDTASDLQDRLIPIAAETVHQHGPAGEHSHKGSAFTVWLDPSLAIEQSRSIHRALTRLMPGQTELLDANLAALSDSLTALDREQKTLFDKFGDQPVLFSHPVYQYLQARYGLNGVSVHWEPGEQPGTKAWIKLREIHASHPARLMLWEDEPLEETRLALLELEITSIPFHTASNRPQGGDYMDLMQANIRRLEALLVQPR